MIIECPACGRYLEPDRNHASYTCPCGAVTAAAQAVAYMVQSPFLCAACDAMPPGQMQPLGEGFWECPECGSKGHEDTVRARQRDAAPAPDSDTPHLPAHQSREFVERHLPLTQQFQGRVRLDDSASGVLAGFIRALDDLEHRSLERAAIYRSGGQFSSANTGEIRASKIRELRDRLVEAAVRLLDEDL